MAVEKLEAEVILTGKANESSFKQLSSFVENENKRLNSEFGLKLSVDLADLRVQQKQLKAQLKQAEKSGDLTAQVSIQAKLEQMREQITTASAELKNFAKRWSTDVSWLDVQFKKITDAIDESRSQVEKVWWSTKWFDMLKEKAIQLNNAFKTGKIDAKEFMSWLAEIQNESIKTSISVWDIAWAIVKVWAWFLSFRTLFWAYKQALADVSSNERLYRLLENTTGATREQVKVLQDQAKALEKVGVVTAGNIWVVQSQLATFDLSVDTIKTLTPAVLDYATAEKWAAVSADELQSLTNWLAQALQGNFGSLTRVWFVLDENTKKMISNWTEAERSQAIVEVLNSTYADFNKNLRDTPEWQLQVFNNTIKDLQQNIWQALIPVFNTLLWVITPVLEWFIAMIQNAPTLTTAIWWVAIATTGLGIALATLWWPLTIALWLLSLIASAVAVFYNKIEDLKDQLWELKWQMEVNRTAQNLLKQEFDKGRISAKEYQERLAKLVQQEIELEGQTTKLQNTTRYTWLKIVAVVKDWAIIIWKIIWAMVFAVGESIFNLGSFIVENIKLVPKNVGIAFDNIGGAIAGWLNSALKKVADFVNKAIFILNKIPWVDITPVVAPKIQWGVSLAFAPLNKQLKYTDKLVTDIKNDMANFWRVDVDQIWWSVVHWWSNPPSLKDLIEEDDKKKWWGWGGGGWADEVIDANKEIEKSLEDLKEEYQQTSDVFKKAMEDSVDRTKKLDDEITKLKDNITDLQTKLDTLETSKVSDLASRYLQVRDAIKDQQDILGSDNEEKKVQAQAKLNELLKEQVLLQQNLTKEQIDEAIRRDSLSATEKILEDYEAQKLSLENDKKIAEEKLKALEEQRLKEAEIYDNLVKTQEDIDKDYEMKKKDLEARITDNVMQESIKRIEYLKQVEQQAIRTAQALQMAGMWWGWSGTSRTTTTNNNSSVVVNATVNNKTDADYLAKRIVNFNKWIK